MSRRSPAPCWSIACCWHPRWRTVSARPWWRTPWLASARYESHARYGCPGHVIVSARRGVRPGSTVRARDRVGTARRRRRRVRASWRVEGAARARPRSRDSRRGSAAALDAPRQRTHAAARSGRGLELPRGTPEASAPCRGAGRVRGAPATPRAASNRALVGALSRSLRHVRAHRGRATSAGRARLLPSAERTGARRGGAGGGVALPGARAARWLLAVDGRLRTGGPARPRAGRLAGPARTACARAARRGRGFGPGWRSAGRHLRHRPGDLALARARDAPSRLHRLAAGKRASAGAVRASGMRRAARAASEPAGSGMSTWAARRPVRLPQAGAAASEAESLRLRMCAFFALASFAVLQYGALLVHPPSARLLAIAAVVTVGGGALTLSSRLPSRRLALAAALAVSLATLALALLVLGVPAHLLLPSRWATLVRDLRGGLRALEGWLWPYRGGREWTRLAVLLPVPVGLTCAAALCFWPSRHIVATRTAALSLLIALFITGAANQPDAAWGVQGSVLAALTAAWLWLPSLAAADLNRAGAWVVICSTLALLLAPLLSARRPWIHYRTWNAAHATTSFQWDQASGPITWSRSNLTMFELQAPRPQLLRVTALDRFDGRRFLRSPAPPGDSRVDIPRTHERSWLSTATVTVGGLRAELLVSDGGLPVAARWLGRRADTDTITAQPDGEAVC